jgi:hypothetical protein
LAAVDEFIGFVVLVAFYYVAFIYAPPVVFTGLDVAFVELDCTEV